MKTEWALVARADAGMKTDTARSTGSEVLICPLCGRAVRAFARTLCEPAALTVFECPGCGALVEEVPCAGEALPALPGATLEELKDAVQQATLEAERWRCQADIARQRKDDAWAEKAVAWSVAAERRAAALRRQAVTADPTGAGRTSP